MFCCYAAGACGFCTLEQVCWGDGGSDRRLPSLRALHYVAQALSAGRRLIPLRLAPSGRLKICLFTRSRLTVRRWDVSGIDVPDDDNAFREQLELSPQERVRAENFGASMCHPFSNSQPAQACMAARLQEEQHSLCPELCSDDRSRRLPRVACSRPVSSAERFSFLRHSSAAQQRQAHVQLR